MRTIPLLGEIEQDRSVPEWWVSAPVPVPYFSGKPMKFLVTLDADEETYPDDVAEAVAAFLALGERGRRAASKRVYENYREFLEATDIEPLPIKKQAEIWAFVTPHEVVVARRNRRDKDVYIQITCECKWEREHGLQLVYRRGDKLVRVSEQDGHLTRADAYDTPDEEDEWLTRSRRR